MTNGLGDLNTHLFAQLDRLTAAADDAAALEREVTRATAMVGLSDQVVAVANVSLAAARLYAQHGKGVMPMLPQIGAHKPEDAA